uniref:Deoxyribonuclease n=1 Tax=Mola mola TaxID=94237 RepID=A0A3Q3WHC6_MOLML
GARRSCSQWRSPCLPLLLLLLVLGGTTVSGFKICAYSVQNFNMAKASDSRLMHTLTRVLSRCDITLLQEVMDSDGKVIKSLMTSLNRYDEHKYQSVSSKSLGNTPGNMQQYVFIYRKGTVNVTGQHQYQKQASFVREPFAVQFQSRRTAIKRFALVALHAEPGRTVEEIDRLYDVFAEVSKKWNNTNVMLLGNFHAGCAHMTRVDKKKIRLFKDSNYFWLIGDKVDTTVSEETNCPYDRCVIVVHGKSFLKAIAPFSAQVIDVSKKKKVFLSFCLTEISDHLPVQVTLKSSARLLQATPLLILFAVSVIVCSFLSPL